MNWHRPLECTWHRSHDRGGAASWLLCFSLGFPPTSAAGHYISPFPQARAVVDDYGTLVPVQEIN